MRVILELALTAVIAGSSSLCAQAGAAPSLLPAASDRPIELALVAADRGIVPGRPLTIGLRLRPRPEWHTYWRYAGDVGSAPSVQWRLPAGFRAGPLTWPAPTLISAPPLASYGYSSETYLLASIQVPTTARIGSRVAIAASVAWVACKVECLAGDANLSLTLPIVSDAAVDSAVALTFDAVRLEAPATRAGWTFSATADSSFLDLAVAPPRGESVSGKALTFFVDTQAVVDHAAPQLASAMAHGVTIRLRRSEYSTATPARLHGVLVVAETTAATAAGETPIVSRRMAVDVDAPIVDARDVARLVASTQPTSGRAPGLIIAIAFALLGGTLLNVMPCVLPVLSLKALRIADSVAQDGAAARREAVLYGVGILLSMWVLVGALLVLRGTGREVGWGFQLQDPAIVGGLALLIFAAALNMSGVFELTAAWPGAISAKQHPTSSALSPLLNGVLVTTLATACSAPFLASAVAFGLTHRSFDTVLVFTALGIGLLWPMIAIAWSVRLRMLLPRPGDWMVTLRQALAFPLYATAAWLTWLVGREAGLDAVGSVLAALTVLAIGLWVYGRFGTPNRPNRDRRVSTITAFAALMLSLVLVLRVNRTDAKSDVHAPSIGPAQAGAATGRPQLAWEAFTPNGLAGYRAAGRTVLLDFTADWCLTCKVNEKVAFGSDRIQKAFAAQNVVLLRADWTRRDATITRALAAFDRNSVPLIVLYPGARGPIVLPTLLSPGALLRALDSAAAMRSTSSSALYFHHNTAN